MNNKKKQEIPLDAFDNELMHQEIIIPDDFKATIEGNKIILTKTENKDERIKNRLIKLIKMSSEVGGFALHKWEADEMLAWLEKQGWKETTEWSEEEEKNISQAIYVCHQHGYTGVEKWLKSIRHQNHWKPSKEQMQALLSEVEGWVKGCPKQKVLESLYNDLKKLTEE